MRGRIVIGALVALALVGSVGAGRATAGLNIDFNLITQPQLVVVPGTPVAYAPTVPANYFFYNGQYYLFADGGWFVARGYNGPWLAMSTRLCSRGTSYRPGSTTTARLPGSGSIGTAPIRPGGPPYGAIIGGITAVDRSAATTIATAETAMITGAAATATMATTATTSDEIATELTGGGHRGPLRHSLPRRVVDTNHCL